MPMEKFSLMVLACIAAFSCAPICSASPKDRQARRNSLAQPVGARKWMNISSPLTEAPPLDAFGTVPDLSPTSACQPYGPCNMFYQVSHEAFLPSTQSR